MELTTNVSMYTAERAVALQLSGKGVADRKVSALSQADSVGLRAIAYGTGTVAKLAREQTAEDDMRLIAEAVASGNLHAFAVKWAAVTAETVKFGLKDHEGKWVRKPTTDFREFGSVIKHKMLQLEDKGKMYTSKGDTYTSAYKDLAYVQNLHTMALQIMDKRDAADAERRAKLAELRQTEELKALLDAAGVPPVEQAETIEAVEQAPAAA